MLQSSLGLGGGLTCTESESASTTVLPHCPLASPEHLPSQAIGARSLLAGLLGPSLQHLRQLVPDWPEQSAGALEVGRLQWDNKGSFLVSEGVLVALGLRRQPVPDSHFGAGGRVLVEGEALPG